MCDVESYSFREEKNSVVADCYKLRGTLIQSSCKMAHALHSGNIHTKDIIILYDVTPCSLDSCFLSFWSNILTPSSVSKSKQSKEAPISAYHMLDHSSTLFASWFLSLGLSLTVTLANFCQTTWHYIPECGTLHSHCCDNLRSHTECSVSKQVDGRAKTDFLAFPFTIPQSIMFSLFHQAKEKMQNLKR
jgi:hypothetical protein